MTETKPMTTQPAGTTGQPAPKPVTPPDPAKVEADAKARTDKLYEMRKTMDPDLYGRVAAFHPHANTSDEAMDAFKADYDRLEKETADAKAKADTSAKPVSTAG